MSTSPGQEDFTSGLRGRLASAIGDRYRIEQELGAGGMATVYLARDLKHDRRVALKVLKPELAAIVGAERFLSEIKTTANLQHPHILALFDSGAVDGTVFYAMPYVEGESLRDRLTREKQLPVNDALRIAHEVADALHHAHGHGVIHRDIKPENILLQGGHALVADFGIALAASSAGGSRMTETGMSLGTPAYMSPEQAMGERALDARTDVYALGCVLYEMLAGEPPFTGPTAQAIVARVITEEPRSLVAQRKTVPLEVDAAIATALAKLPADRFATAAAFAEALQGGPLPPRRAPRVSALAPAHSRWFVPALGMALLLTAAFAAWGWTRRTLEPSVTRTFVAFPEAESPRMQRPLYALLPDGSAMVYVGRGASAAAPQLWIKKRSELHATPLGGTAGASTVFVSPNGEWIGFIVGNKVMKVPLSGGQPVVLGDASCNTLGCQTYPSGAFLDDGSVVIHSADALVTLGPNGGTADSLVTSQAVGGFTPLYPSALPGSRGVVFTACTLYCNKADLWVVDVATRKARRLMEHAARPVYVATGHLVYLNQQGSAFAIPFDLGTMALRGTATRVLDRVVGGLAVSRDGTLLYAEGDAGPRSELVVVSRDGTEQPVDTTWRGNFATLALSPDGERLAASIVTVGEEHLWVKTLGGGPPARLTFDKAQYTTPTWSADGSSLLHTRFASESASFLSRRADGTGGVVVLKRGADWVIESAVSHDGEWVVQREYRPDGTRDIFARRLRGDSTLRPVVATPVSDFSPALSPDGKWLAYVNDESGRPEVWVVPFPEPGGARWQVSRDEGTEPSWSRDGRELFYVNEHRALVSVSVGAGGSSFTVGQHRNLFSVEPYRRHPTHRAYDVLPGNRGFVMIRDGSPTTSDMVLVDHWFTELRQKLRAP